MSEEYCLFATCGKWDSCGKDYPIVCVEEMSLAEAQKKYLSVQFCQNWVPTKEEDEGGDE